MPIYVKNGTPLNGPSLCETCSLAFIAHGYRESECVVVCQATEPARAMKFRVRECTSYADKIKRPLWEMQKMALILDSADLKREAGFMPPNDTASGGEKIELILDENEEQQS